MNRTRLFYGLGLAVLTLAIAVPVAFSHGPGPDRDGRDGKRGDHRGRIIEKLGLDEKQAATLEKLRDDHRDQARSLHEQTRTKREALKALWLEPNPDKARILAAEREIQALHGQLVESKVEFMFAARRVLTADQFKRFVELKRGFGGHGRHGRHWRQGGMDDAPAPEGDDAE